MIVDNNGLRFWPTSFKELTPTEAATGGVLLKKLFLKISQNSQENTCARVSFLINCKSEACNFIRKETLALMFSGEFCEIFKNTYFEEHLQTTASTPKWYMRALLKFYKVHGKNLNRTRNWCFHLLAALLKDNGIPANICLFKVNIRNNRTRCIIGSKLTLKTPERHTRFFL